MNADPDVTRVVRSWLRQDAHENADRVLDSVLDQLEWIPQRRAGWLARRFPIMNSSRFRYGIAAAAIVAAAFLGLRFLPSSNVGGPGPAPTPTPTVAPTPSPTPEGLLPQGPHVLNHGEPLEGMPTLRTTVTIPASDWYGEAGDGILIKNDNADAPDGAGMITFFGDLYVYGDPCQWSTTRPDTPATTVEELIAALTAQASRDASAPEDVTVDGYAGKSITLHVPEDAVFSECDQGTFGSWGMDSPDPSPFRYHQDPGQIDKLWILDVDGELVVIDAAYYKATPQAVVDELHAIVESVSFDA